MIFFINELSFQSQAKHRENASGYMRHLAKTMKEIKPLRGDKPVRSHSQLHQMLIAPNWSVYEWLVHERDSVLRQLFLVTTKGPFVDSMLDEALDFHECRCGEQDVSGYSIAVASHFGGCLLSLREAKTNGYDQPYILAKFRRDGGVFQEVKIPNLISVVDVWHIRRKYEPNPKHDFSKPTHGVRGSIMDLNKEQAQSVLDKGIKNGDKVYGYLNGRYYAFQAHHSNVFHGYQIADNELPQQLAQRLKDRGIFP